MGLLDGRVVLVTGGGRGIGAAISRVAAREGAYVAVNYAKNRDTAEAVVAEITERGGTGAAFGADVCDAEAVDTMVKAIHERWGRIDGVVNNAISGKHNCSFADASRDDYQAAFNYGCVGPLNVIRAARPFMKAQSSGGRVINIITSMWPSAPGGWSVYLAGKGALVGVSRSLARELGPEKITVNMVSPGWMADEKVDVTSEVSRNYGAGLPLGWHGSADEIGSACVFFLSDLSQFITGAFLPVNGGVDIQMS